MEVLFAAYPFQPGMVYSAGDLLVSDSGLLSSITDG